MTLGTLLARSRISRWDVETWFTGATLTGQILTVPDVLNAGFIERNWLVTMRDHVPGLEIVVKRVEPVAAWDSVLNAKGKQAYRGQVRGPRQVRLLE